MFLRPTTTSLHAAQAAKARTEPYACGWPLNNPGGPNSGWNVATGAVFPNVRLDDEQRATLVAQRDQQLEDDVDQHWRQTRQGPVGQ